MKNVKTGVEKLRNEVAILKEANNKIPLESLPKQNHKVNENKTTQTTQNVLHNDEREPKRTNAGYKQKQETYSRDRRQPQDMKSSKTERKRILIADDSQLHGIDQTRMSSKNDIKVGSQVQRPFDTLDEEMQHKLEEVIVHVGVNDIENDNMEELIENFNEISNVYADRFKITFSEIICRSDKP